MFIDPEMLSRLRHRMMSVAYRMLGTVADAEDGVPDAFVRFQEAGGVSSPKGFLVRTTTRLCTSCSPDPYRTGTRTRRKPRSRLRPAGALPGRSADWQPAPP